MQGDKHRPGQNFVNATLDTNSNCFGFMHYFKQFAKNSVLSTKQACELHQISYKKNIVFAISPINLAYKHL